VTNPFRRARINDTDVIIVGSPPGTSVETLDGQEVVIIGSPDEERRRDSRPQRPPPQDRP
jgi:hypothetical protein